ncbi:unnamed protein product [Closterium sp. NIES-65]|nr:unnamed protein product [Closterium sp. NIES-65]
MPCAQMPVRHRDTPAHAFLACSACPQALPCHRCLASSCPCARCRACPCAAMPQPVRCLCAAAACALLPPVHHTAAAVALALHRHCCCPCGAAPRAQRCRHCRSCTIPSLLRAYRYRPSVTAALSHATAHILPGSEPIADVREEVQQSYWADRVTYRQWTSRDATAQFAIRTHLPHDQRAYFCQVTSAQALYDAVVRHYSSPSAATIGRLALPFLFPELSNFTTVVDLTSHVRSLDTRYRAALMPYFLAENQPVMYLTLYFLTTRLPYSLHAIPDHFPSLDLIEPTLASFETCLFEAETSARAVAASRGSPSLSFFERCSPSHLVPSVASADTADFLGAEEVITASL